ncbi:bifunctional nicotinamidase/pyrazinamidase [Oleisolibacter albus]|uniref:bifunctional nicotinamidase/pyrazinamidase n=1 Tax=Oleisolibacter albus TaxID=2171757 RepID=UPI000DF20629|nr:bifunctional nicotinamidase/pyrazinamidase [Oleisolibacter albus]
MRITDTDALLLVDIQRDFCPGGALAVTDGAAVVPLANDLARRFPLVVLTQDWHPAGHGSFASTHGRPDFSTIEMPYGPQVLWPDHCVQGTAGAAFHPDLETGHAALVLRKGMHRNIDSYSAFFENDHRTSTGLAGYLRERGVRRVVLCGLATDFCVSWSAEDAVRCGFEAVIVEDACRAIDLDGSLAAARRRWDAVGVTTTGSGTLG